LKYFRRFRLKVFLVRLGLSCFFAYFLMHFFIPMGGALAWLVVVGLLLFFAYLFEAVHTEKNKR